MAVATQTAPAQRESFAALLNESMGVANSLEGTVVKGRVISIENDAALIDVGLKSEGRVPLKEFAAGGQEPEIHVGDTVEVFLERMEDKNGEASLSRASRSFMSCRTSPYITVAPRCRNSRSRRSARASALAVTKSLTVAPGQTAVPMSRPSRTAPRGLCPFGGAGGWAAKSRCRSSKAARTSGIAATTEEACATSSVKRAGSAREARSTRRAAGVADCGSAGLPPAARTRWAVAR